MRSSSSESRVSASKHDAVLPVLGKEQALAAERWADSICPGLGASHGEGRKEEGQRHACCTPLCRKACATGGQVGPGTANLAESVAVFCSLMVSESCLLSRGPSVTSPI